MKTKKLLIIPTIITLIGTLLMIGSIFLPYATATDDTLEFYESYPDYELSDGITAGDMIDVSMAEFAYIYATQGEEAFGDELEAMLYLGMIVLIGVLSVLALVFGLFRKPVVAMIFGYISFWIYKLQCWDYVDRGVIDDYTYVWGIGHSMYYIALCIAFVGVVWMIACKAKLEYKGIK